MTNIYEGENSSAFDEETYRKAEELAIFVATETPFTVKDADVERHNIHHWIQLGLFPQKGENKKIRMNFLEFVWLKILKEIRSVGLSSDALKKLYRQLYKPLENYTIYKKISRNLSFIDDELQIPESEKEKIKEMFRSGKWEQEAKTQTRFAPLLVLIAEAIQKRTFVSIAVYLDGSYSFLVDDSLHLLPSLSIRRLKTETHLVVSITNILSHFLGDKRFQSLVPNLSYFSAQEIKVLELIRSRKYDSIKIKFSNKKMDFIELGKHENTHRKIVDILSENNFQSIEISTQHGKISRITNTVKVKV
jgi:DNA-binding transcriptional MerR regulator